jgi:HEAT repeat protein
MSKRAKLAYLADLEEGYRPFDKHAFKLLQSLLQDPDAEVRAEAIACLWNDPDVRWINVLMRIATDDPHVDVRAHAISVLGRYVYEGEQARLDDWTDIWEDEITPEDYQRVIEFLFRIAHDPDEPLTTRRYAIEALAFRSDDPGVADLIEWAYHHPDRRMKVSALFAMARHGHERWDKYILAELHSPDAQIQYEAVRAAGELGITEATETLIELATRKGVRKPLRLLAIYALGETGDARAYPVLEKLSRARDRDVRDVARDALEEWLMFSQFEEMMDANDLEESFTSSAFPDVWDAQTGTFSKN